MAKRSRGLSGDPHRCYCWAMWLPHYHRVSDHHYRQRFVQGMPRG